MKHFQAVLSPNREAIDSLDSLVVKSIDYSIEKAKV